jgi:hypothetical protein
MKTCAEKAAYNAAWKAAHPDYFVKYQEANRERIAARQKKNREANIEKYKIREAAQRKAHPDKHREWASKHREHLAAYKVAWTKANREKQYASTVRARKRNPEQNMARSLLNDAIRTGKMTKGACVICGEVRTQGHHSDYSKPLDVIWLCQSHHRQLHLGKLDMRTAKFVGEITGLSVCVERLEMIII